MSVERLQTVVQMSAQGADQVIAEFNRVVNALRSAHTSLGDTSFSALGIGGNNVGQSVAAVRPGAYNRLEGLQAAQELAQRKLNDAIKREEELRKRKLGKGETQDMRDAKIRVAENASLAAAIRENKARETLANEIYKLLPAVLQRAEQEKRGAQMAREVEANITAEKKAVASLEAQRRKGLQQQVADEAKAAAETARRNAVALTPAEVSQIVATPTRQFGDTDRTFAARQRLAEAQNAQAVAASKAAAAAERALLGDGATGVGVREAQARLREALLSATNAHSRSSHAVERAEEGLRVALQNQALVHAQATRSFRENFITGFRGRGQNPAPYGEQLGQAFKFSLFYGSAYKMLFALTQTLQATFTEGVAFQQGMTNLALATGRPKEELDNLANSLSESATRAGFAPSQGIEIGARAMGLYGVTESDAATQNRVAQISARVVNQLAVGSKKEPVDLQGDIAAIGQALGMGAAGQFRIADLDAYMTKKFGVQQGSTLEVVGQSASVGKAAGFTDEQLFAIAADMLSRTGQSGSAVSGYMAQIFSRGGEGSLVDVARKQGIDPNQDLAVIIEQLSQVYKQASGPEQAEISAAFGRGKIQNAAVALLADYDEVLKRSGQAMSDASGEADRQFNIRMGDIGGQVAQLMGVMREFASQLGESGLLDVVGLAVVTFRELLESVNGFLKVWNTLPNAIQDVVLVLGALAVAGRAGVGAGLLQNIALARPGTARGLGLAAMGTGVAGASAGLRSNTGLRGLTAAGIAASGMVIPIAGAIAALVAIGSLKNSADRMGEAQEAATQALLRPSAGIGSSASDYRAYAAELTSLKTQNRDATGWFMNAITFGQADNSNERTADQLKAEAKRMNAIADRLQLEEQLRSAGGGMNSSAFKSTGAEDIEAGISALESGGVTARQQLNALRDALFGTADAAKAAADTFDIKDFAEQGAGGAINAARAGLQGTEFSYMQPGGGGFAVPTTMKGSELNDALREYLTGDEATKRLQAGLAQAGVSSLADLDSGTAEQVAAVVGKDVASTIMAPFAAFGGGAYIPSMQARIDKSIAKWLREQGRPTADLLSGDKMLTSQDAKVAADELVKLSDSNLGRKADIDSEGRVNVLRARVRDLRRLGRHSSSDALGYINEQIADARKLIARTQIEELERLRRIAQRNAKSKAEIANIGRSFLEREINAAVRGGDADALVGILEMAGKGAIEMARKAIREALNIAKAAIQISSELAQFGNEVNGMLQGAGAAFRQIGGAERAAEGGNKTQRAQIKAYRTMLRGIGKVLSARGDDDVFKTGSDSGNPLLDPKDAASEDSSPAHVAAARAAAFATRSESQIAAARAAIIGAKASIRDAKKGTVEYWDAMGQLFAAQNQMTDAVEAYKHNLGMLSIDITNPLAEARLAVRDAVRKLRNDRGKGADVRAQDKVDLRSARANAEATAFSQRLQSVQTAEELGRISHSKYIHYLESEKRRLESIKHRTFQQQDQLNQIDKLMQDAAKQMQGQFNLGDIHLPTPYQVRRYIEQTSPAKTERMAARVGTSTTNLVMNVDGADTAKVTQIVQTVVGKAARTKTAAPRRR